MASTCWNCHTTLRNGVCPACDVPRDPKPPAPKPDPRDARIAELERTLDRYSKEDGSGIVQRQQARIAELEAELSACRKSTLARAHLELAQERDQARAECERLREAHSEHPVTTSSSCSENAKSEQEKP